jgi:hypothetical protein
MPSDPSIDIDEQYLESGEPTLPPIEMQERLYNAIRYQRHSSKKYDHMLKKNDVIKMGRVKLKVHTIYDKKQASTCNMKFRRRIKRV